MNRTDDRADVLTKVTGQAQYTNDIKLENLTYGKVVHCPYPHAKVVEIKMEEALAQSGVIRIITAKDIPGVHHQHKQKPMIVSDEAKYVGEGVAVVIGETMEAAIEGAKRVSVIYEELPAVLTPEEALKEGAPKVHEDGNILCTYKTSKGDVEEGFKNSDYIFERDYETQKEDHIPIEPEAAIAVPTPEGMTIYAPTNSVYNVRQTISQTLGVDEHCVRLIAPTIGGSFGAKNYDLAVMASRAAIAATLTKRPCKIVYTREESIMEGTKRHPYKLHYKVGVKKDGTIMAVKVNILGDGGAYTSKSFPVASRSAIEAAGPYRVANSLAEITLAYTNTTYSDAMRGFGSPQVDFSSEVLWDEVAITLGMDPLTFRKKNHLSDGDISSVGQKMTDVTIDQCLVGVETQIPWTKRKAQIAIFNKKNKTKKRGLGLAIMHRGEAFGAAGQGLDTAAVNLHTNWDGSITILSSMAEVGMGGHAMLVNIVHEVLGLPKNRIRVSLTDTDYCPNSGPTVATRGALLPGNACKMAAEQLKEAYGAIGEEKLGVPGDTLVFKDGKIYDPNDVEHFLNYEDVVMENHSRANSGYGHGWFTVDGLVWDGSVGNGEAYLCYVYGACIAEVEVNLGTGQVSVVDITQANDVGHAFDKEEVLGQINGGLVMGLGYGLFEDIEMRNGTIKNLNFDSYLIPTAMDIPDLKSVVIEEPGAFGPFGAKGLGEPTACLAAPAVINAIADATGVYIRNIPANLEKVLKAVGEKNK